MTTTAPPTAQQASEQARQQLLQFAGGSMPAAALYTVCKLNIPDKLANGPRTAAELAAETGTNPDALYRVLRALVNFGVLEVSAPGAFALAASAQLLRSDVPGSIRDLVIFVSNPLHFKTWSGLPYSVQTGKPAFEHVYGKPAFEVFNSDPNEAEEFNRAMTCISSRLAPAVLDAYDFSGIGTLMDVAGGHGFVLCQILEHYPNMKGVLFDTVGVIEGAKCFVCELNLDERCTPVAGNFFEDIPSGADAYFMQHTIHDWDDEHALKILGNCRRALEGRRNGKLLVVDCVLPENGAPHYGNLLDLEMLLLPGGRERTEAEFRALFAKAGFEITRIVPTREPESVIEARVK